MKASKRGVGQLNTESSHGKRKSGKTSRRPPGSGGAASKRSKNIKVKK